MGNVNCRNCIKKPNQNEVNFRENSKKERDTVDFMILIQSIYRGHLYRMKLSNNMTNKEIYHNYKFQESWDNFFKHHQDVEFTLNYLHNLYIKICQFYN